MTNTTRHALPLPVTLLIAWAVGIAVFLALRALTSLIPNLPTPPSPSPRSAPPSPWSSSSRRAPPSPAP